MRDLAERFGVSTMPVREALRRLEAEGLIEFDKNRSITVRSLSRAEADEVFTIRSILEPLAARRATKNLQHDEAALGRLESLIDLMDTHPVNGPEWPALNREFHVILWAHAGMPRLQTMLTTLWASIDIYLGLFRRTDPHVAEAQRQHRAMLAALREGDEDRVEELMRRQVTWGEGAITNYLVERNILDGDPVPA